MNKGVRSSAELDPQSDPQRDLSAGHTIDISQDELNRCKRVLTVLAEAFKVMMDGKKAPLEMREDMATLIRVLRRLESIAKLSEGLPTPAARDEVSRP